MKRLFKSMAQAETAYNEHVLRLDLSNLALDAVFNGQVTWHNKAHARKVGVGAVGWAKLDAPHGGIILHSWGGHINTVERLDDFLQRISSCGIAGGPEAIAYWRGAAEAARAARTEACHKDAGADVTVEGHGSLFLFRPNTTIAATWLREHVAAEASWMGPALAVEHRYAVDFAEAIRSDGGFTTRGAL